MSRVRALEAGYDNVAVRQPGEKFDWPDTKTVGDKEVPNPIPRWCEKLAGDPKPAKNAEQQKGKPKDDATALA